MTRPYEMPFDPAPPLVGTAPDLIPTGVLVEQLIRTDPLALGLNDSCILLGGVACVVLDRARGRPDREAKTGIEITPGAEG